MSLSGTALLEGEKRAAGGFTTERLPLAGLVDIAAEWQRLAARATEPNIFYDPAFALAAITEASSFLGADIEAIIVWGAGPTRRAIGLFPFRIAPRRYLVRLPILIGWTHAFAPLGTPLVDRDAGAQVVDAFLDHVATDEALPKLMLLPQLNEGGPVAAMLAASLRRRGGALRAFDRHCRALVEPGSERAGYIERAPRREAPQGTAPPTSSARRRERVAFRPRNLVGGCFCCLAAVPCARSGRLEGTRRYGHRAAARDPALRREGDWHTRTPPRRPHCATLPRQRSGCQRHPSDQHRRRSRVGVENGL